MRNVLCLKLIVLAAAVALLFGCGVAHVKTDVEAGDFSEYKKLFIQSVKVYSNEEAAETNAPLQKKLKSWETYSLAELEKYALASDYELIKSLAATDGETISLSLDVSVTYGNRALRWAVGFGAGKGGVHSILTAKNSITGEVLHRVRADSDLAVGGAGGDIGNVLEENIRTLIKQYGDAQNIK